jgi:hypothetical protein
MNTSNARNGALTQIHKGSDPIADVFPREPDAQPRSDPTAAGRSGRSSDQSLRPVLSYAGLCGNAELSYRLNWTAFEPG